MLKPPFSFDQFHQVIADYNTIVFPVQVLWLLMGIGALLFIHTSSKGTNRYISFFLGILWLWNGLAYHFMHFAAINNAAWIFGAVFILQGLFFLFESFIKRRISYRFTRNPRNYTGYFLIIFGLILYPLIGMGLGIGFGNTISLGLPCPSTILTFGFLMIAGRSLPRYLLIIPTLWAIIGTSAAFYFGVYHDIMLIIAALIADIWLLSMKKRPLKTDTTQV